MHTFASRLNICLQKNKMTAAELSRRTGIDEGTISNYKKGKYVPKQIKLDKIAHALNTSVAYLLGQTDNDNTTFPTTSIAEQRTSEENEIISLFSELPTEKKKLVIDLIKNLSK